MLLVWGKKNYLFCFYYFLLDYYPSFIQQLSRTISSGLNSLATVCLKDFVQPLYYSRNKVNMSEHFSTNITKLIGKFYFDIGISTSKINLILLYLAALSGLLVICLSFMCTVLKLTGKI